MSDHRFSILQNKGWLRLTLIASIAFIPIAIIEHSLGLFNDGINGLIQASEFVGGGIGLVMVLALPANWVAKGFLVRLRTEDPKEERGGKGAPAGPQMRLASASASGARR